ncbi:MAG TPA: hypothetical protein VGE00_09300 [Gammaproteobacteria bacterium]
MNNQRVRINNVMKAAAFGVMLTLSSSLCATVAPPARPLTAEQIATSLGFVDKLINKSSVARDIEESNFAPAIAYLAAARRLYQQAQAELADRKLSEAASHRDEAIHLMMEAGHLARLALKPDQKPEADYEKRLSSIQALLEAHERAAQEKDMEKSTASLRTQVAPILRAADQLAKAGEFAKALNEANLAYAAVKQSLNELRGGETLGQISTVTVDSSERLNDEYVTRLRSINALLEAYQRIATEKSQGAQSKSLNDQVNTLLGKASRSAASRNYEEANSVLLVAYEQVRDALEQLRGGETLVRSLNFATPEEEYRYELDRNDTYRMLITMLIEEKKTMNIDTRVQQFLDEAGAYRKQGENEAASGNFAQAIKTMEQSTRSLIAAMRNAGIFIPG